MQDYSNPLNGKMLESSMEVREIVQAMQHRHPFIAELIGENGRILTLGLGSGKGCVQFSSSDGLPPYLVAVGDHPEAEGDQDFLCGSTPSPVAQRHCLPMQRVIEIAAVFLDSGERDQTIEWEEI
jgi:hypothetical protein